MTAFVKKTDAIKTKVKKHETMSEVNYNEVKKGTQTTKMLLVTARVSRVREKVKVGRSDCDLPYRNTLTRLQTENFCEKEGIL